MGFKRHVIKWSMPSWSSTPWSGRPMSRSRPRSPRHAGYHDVRALAGLLIDVLSGDFGHRPAARRRRDDSSKALASVNRGRFRSGLSRLISTRRGPAVRAGQRTPVVPLRPASISP
jgi:hypothetical protein